MQRRMLLATLLLTVLAAALTWWMLKRQLAPALDAARALSSLSDANEPPRALPITRADEIGELVGGFNRLLEALTAREKELQESEAFKNSILNAMAARIAVVNCHGDIQAVNKRWWQASVAEHEGGEPGKSTRAASPASRRRTARSATITSNFSRPAAISHRPSRPCGRVRASRPFSMAACPASAWTTPPTRRSRIAGSRWR